MTTQRRDPNIDLEKVGIRLGDILSLRDQPDITCIVTQLYPTQVAYDGQLLSLSAAAQKARNVNAANGAVEWTFEGKTLDQRRRNFEDWHKLSG